MHMQDAETVRRCWQAVAAWRANGEQIVAEACSLRWTYERAQAFARSLARLFHEYNHVLWERFPYCRRCVGGCCVLDATHVGTFDAIALALLDRAMPTLPGEIETTARGCIYLTAHGCAWPAEWRPIKCWSFYCLGGGWESSPSSVERYSAVTGELERVVLGLLPDELRRYEVAYNDSLVAYLGDPLDFAEALGDALFEVFVAPFYDRYPAIAGEPSSARLKGQDAQGSVRSDIVPDVLAFVSEAVEQACQPSLPVLEGVEVAVEQLLADLELLEWIVLGLPEHGARLLEEIHLRYARAPAPRTGEQATVWYRMRDHVLRLRNNWEGLACI
jgi:hypothetical protein